MMLCGISAQPKNRSTSHRCSISSTSRERRERVAHEVPGNPAVSPLPALPHARCAVDEALWRTADRPAVHPNAGGCTSATHQAVVADVTDGLSAPESSEA